MGLDMYLEARKYISGVNYGKTEDGDFTKTVNPEFTKMIEPLGLTVEDLERDLPSATLEVKVAYWRKVNAVHNWFVNEAGDGEDDCKPIWVDRDKLIELRNLCQQVLDNPETASELLPSASGFFFGGTEYDEWYFNGLTETVDQLDHILNNDKFNGWDFQYQASW